MPENQLGVVLQFSTQRDPASWLIRYMTWSEYSHVDLVLSNGDLLGARYDGGVRVRPPDYANFSKVDRYFYPCPNPAFAIQWALTQVGKPYDWFAILNFFLQRSHYWRALDRWFCSEYMNGMFDFTGQAVLNADDCDHITPRDLTLARSGIKMIRNEAGVWSIPAKEFMGGMAGMGAMGAVSGV